MRTNIKATFQDIAVVLVVSILIVSYYLRGPTTGADTTMHLSKVRIIMSSFPNLPRWNPYWYFGIPFLRTYSGLFHYSFAGLGVMLSIVYANLPINVLLSLTTMKGLTMEWLIAKMFFTLHQIPE